MTTSTRNWGGVPADERETHPRDAWTDVVVGLLDAREDPASARFDAELSTAVADGLLPADTARRLRFWQRASVRALTDHIRTVVPVALGALDAARREAGEYVESAAVDLDEAVPRVVDVRAVASAETAETAETAMHATAGPGAREDRPRLLVAGLAPAWPTRTDRTT